MKNTVFKKFSLILMMTLFAFTLTACGGSASSSVTMDGADICSKILNIDCFSDVLTETDSSYVSTFLGIESSEYVNCNFYIGSGATSERLVFFEASDTETAKTLYDLCNDHIAKLITDYEGYKPEELDKLDRAIVKTKGKYVILCVAGNTTSASSIINQYFD